MATNIDEDNKLLKAKDMLLNNIGFILIIIVFAVYIGKTFIDVGFTGKTIAQIVMDGLFGLIFGWVIKSTLSEQGILRGLNSKILIDTKKCHSEQTIKIKEYRPQLNSFCEQKTIELRVKLRTDILARKNIRYEDVFCDDPNRLDKVIDNRLTEIANRLQKLNDASITKDYFFNFKLRARLSKEKREIMKLVDKAWSVKLNELYSGDLTSDGGRPDNPYDFGETIQQYTSKKAIGKLVFAFTSMIAFGIVNVGFKDWNLGTFIWAIIQMFAFVASGLWSLFRSYMFIIDRYRKGIIKKIDLLEEFEVCCKEHKTFTIPEEIISVKNMEESNG